MTSKMYWTMTLALGLNNVFASKDAEVPKYLWRECHSGSSRNLYNSKLEVDNVYENDTIRMSDYEDQVLLIVNVASYWGFTPQYYALNDLIEKFNGTNLSVLGFPCNQFARQEPAANYTELYNGMAWVRPGMQRGYNFYPFFPLTKKLEVNGKDSHPIFNHLKRACPAPWEEFWPSEKILYEPKHGSDIRWNFEKWLISKDGQPFRRYHSYTEPYNLEEDIKFLLGQSGEPSFDGNAIEYHEERIPKEQNLDTS